MNDQPTLTFACELDERAEWEIESKGFFFHGVVHLPEGGSVGVCFYDPVRLSQDLESYREQGKKCLAEPGLIVIPSVTVENMRAAVAELYQDGYFHHLRSADN